MKIEREEILKKLSNIIDPITKCNIVDAAMVSHISVSENNEVRFSLEIEEDSFQKRKCLISQCTELLESDARINKVLVAITNKPGIARKTIIVASGKGGVGKSTVALNIAIGIANQGYKVGIVDTDIYGPSIPHMLGIREKPKIKAGKMVPLEKYGVKSMSIGYFVPVESAVIWRGPMVTKNLQQMILGSLWNSLDYMIIDSPPGTGDVHITLSKICKISYAIIVTTPQEIACIDAMKANSMFKKLGISVLGIIENMSYICNSTGEKNYIFGKSGGRKLAERCSVRYLGEIPIDNAISFQADLGKPAIIDKQVEQYFTKILEKIL